MKKASEIFTPEEIRIIKLILKVFKGQIVFYGYDRSTDPKTDKNKS